MDPAAAAAAAEFEVLLDFLRHQRLIVDYFHLACYTLLFWDYILTISAEYQLIWRADWSYTKIIYLVTRYLPIINVYFLVYNQMIQDVSPETCHSYYWVVTWIIFLAVECGEIILAVRTWAVWAQNKWLGGFLALVLLGTIVVSCTTLTLYLKSLTFGPPPYPGFRGCLITHISTVLVANFISLTVLDSIVLMLMVLSALRSYRAGLNNQLMNVIHRDGVMFYVYLLILAIANVVVIYALPISLANLLTPWQSCLCSIFTSRIILNIRSEAKKGNQYGVHTELHFKQPVARQAPYSINTTMSRMDYARRNSLDDEDFSMTPVVPSRGARV